ncbi:putative swirm domain containing protein [Naviculisporaceae sp. PSN 640]
MAEGNQFWPSHSTSTSIPPTTSSRVLRATPSPAPMEPKKSCDISKLLISPPEPAPYESFNTSLPPSTKPVADVKNRPAPGAPLSPPVSPFTKASHTISPLHTVQPDNKDVILYPLGGNSMSPAPDPLFNNPMESIEVVADFDRLVDQHIASRPADLFRQVPPPSRDEYELALEFKALYFKSNVVSQFNQNRKAWLSQQRESLHADRRYTSLGRHTHRLPPIMPAAQPMVSRLPMVKPVVPNPNRVQKIKSPRIKIQSQPPRPIRATSTSGRGTIQVSATPEPRTQRISSKEDKDFMSLPDYCPPLSTLIATPNALKVDWKGNPLDLGKDPYKHMLHADELRLAAGLRLDCATYLTTKRRIFIERVKCAKNPKEFRKTDAQKACHIDVNKASKLWTAFDRAGWFDLKYFRHLM